MLRQLTDLTLEADGRYAQDYELQFLEDYLNSQELRIQVYEKIRDSAEEIVEQVRLVKQKRDPEFDEFYVTCKRDLTQLIRYSAAALLFDDLERLRTNMLIWYQSIARSFHYDDENHEVYDALLEVMPKFFSAEELKVVAPVFELNKAVLT